MDENYFEDHSFINTSTLPSGGITKLLINYIDIYDRAHKPYSTCDIYLQERNTIQVLGK